jgi:hypothetical protein
MEGAAKTGTPMTRDRGCVPLFFKTSIKDCVEGGDIESHCGNKGTITLTLVQSLPGTFYARIVGVMGILLFCS